MLVLTSGVGQEKIGLGREHDRNSRLNQTAERHLLNKSMLLRASRYPHDESTPIESTVVRNRADFFHPVRKKTLWVLRYLNLSKSPSLEFTHFYVGQTLCRYSCVVVPHERRGRRRASRTRELTIEMIGRCAWIPRANSTDLSKAAEKCPLRSRSYLLQEFRIARRTQRACERSDAKQRRRTVSPMDGSENRCSITVT